MNVKTLLGLGAIAGAAFALGRYSFRSDVDDLRAQLQSFKLQLASAKPVVHETRTVIREVSAVDDAEEGANSPASPEAVAAPAPELSPEEQEYRAEVHAEAQVKLLSETFDQEPMDSTWAQAARRTLEAAFETAGVSGPYQVECRSSLCRVTFSGSDPGTGLEQYQAILQRSPWNGGRYSTYNLETGEGAAYLTREGLEMPRVDATKLTY